MLPNAWMTPQNILNQSCIHGIGCTFAGYWHAVSVVARGPEGREVQLFYLTQAAHSVWDLGDSHLVSLYFNEASYALNKKFTSRVELYGINQARLQCTQRGWCLTISFHFGSCGFPIPHTQKVLTTPIAEVELTMAWLGSEIVKGVNFPWPDSSVLLNRSLLLWGFDSGRAEMLLMLEKKVLS